MGSTPSTLARRLRPPRKWVIDSYETVVISGWQTSQTRRAIRIHDRGGSYGRRSADATRRNRGGFFKERVVTYTTDTSKNQARNLPAPSASAPAAAGAAREESRAKDEYAATGMGRRTDHAVEQVWLNLEDAPSHVVNIRYEFRPQLVRLGIVPPPRTADPLVRREGARGFEPGLAPNRRGKRTSLAAGRHGIDPLAVSGRPAVV